MNSTIKNHSHDHNHQHKHTSVNSDVSQTHFPCEQCGADLTYSPDSQDLVCSYCGFQNDIPVGYQPIIEHDFQTALNELDRLKHVDKNAAISVIRCPSCAAQFSLEDEFSGDCPFCGTPVVTSTDHARFIQPESLLPFSITEQQAVAAFDK